MHYCWAFSHKLSWAVFLAAPSTTFYHKTKMKHRMLLLSLCDTTKLWGAWVHYQRSWASILYLAVCRSCSKGLRAAVGQRNWHGWGISPRRTALNLNTANNFRLFWWRKIEAWTTTPPHKPDDLGSNKSWAEALMMWFGWKPWDTLEL